MVRAAALVSGDGARLQAILDSMYFKEIPNFELVAVISTAKEVNAMKRALNAGVPAYVVDPELFPNTTSHSMAVANKLRDMDIELVILAGYDLPLGVIPYQFKNRIIGTYPALYPAFEDCEGDIQRAVLEHHEKENGSGYPRHIATDNISTYAKIIAVACAFEASTAPRHYRSARPKDEAMLEILRNSSKQYDENVIKALLYSFSVGLVP